MKMKRTTVWILCALLLLSLVGCSAQEKSSFGSAAPDRNYANENITPEVENTSNLPTGQKLIQTVTMTAETENLDPVLDEIDASITQLKGYVESANIQNGSAYNGETYRRATMTVRIPSKDLDAFLNKVEGVASIVSSQRQVEDVTLNYVATESRIKALQAEEARLLELVAKASSLSELLTMEKRLTEVRTELEKVTSSLKAMENKVDYATIHLSIHQVKVYTEVEEQTVWQRIGSGFKENLRDIGENAVDFFVWVVTYSPQLLLWAVIAAVVITVIKKKRQKRSVSTAPTDNDAQT
jgi:type IV pilus biogenesis protein CpaD/CtpE